MNLIFNSKNKRKTYAILSVIAFCSLFFYSLPISNGLGMYLDDLPTKIELNVLFDESHNPGYGITGLNPCFDNNTKYALFASEMESQGFIFDVVSAGSEINSSVLVNHDIFIVCASLIPYTTDEINAIYNWTCDGGSLLLMGDHSSYSDGVASLASKFGYTFVSDMIRDFDDHMGTIYWPKFSSSNFRIDEFSYNVDQIALYGITGFSTVAAGSDISVFTDNDNTTTWDDSLEKANNVPIICKNSYWNNTAGKIVILGDTNLWTDDDPDSNSIVNYNELDNSQLAINIMTWLATPNTTTGVPLTGFYLSLFMSMCMFVFIGYIYSRKHKK